MKKVIEFFKREDGVTAPEYALIAALIAAVIIGAVTTRGTTVEAVFTDIVTAMGGGAG